MSIIELSQLGQETSCGDPQRSWRPAETHADLPRRPTETVETHGDLQRLWRPAKTVETSYRDHRDPWRPPTETVETHRDLLWRPTESSGNCRDPWRP